MIRSVAGSGYWSKVPLSRRPTLQDSMRVLLDHGVSVENIVDVGVGRGTPFLIETFPECFHYLFEPAEQYWAHIEDYYRGRGIAHSLERCAVSARSGQGILEGYISHDQADCTPTHYQLVDAATPADPGTRQHKPIRLTSLDDWYAGRELVNLLLKIDVDGRELDVLQGAADLLRDTSVVVIEADLGRHADCGVLTRMATLFDKGFYLFDIADHCYYRGILWQADLVFLRREVFEVFKSLSPMNGEMLDMDEWKQLK